MWGRGCVVDSAHVGQGAGGGQCPCGAGVAWWRVPRRDMGCVVDSAHAGQGLRGGQHPCKGGVDSAHARWGCMVDSAQVGQGLQ